MGTSGDQNDEPPIAIPVGAGQMADWIYSNAEDGKTYFITISGTQTIGPQNLDFGAKSVTVIVEGSGTLKAFGRGSLFSVNSGAALILNGVTLQGVSDNNVSLVAVNNGGSLIMNSGKITANTKIGGAGGGVSVTGTFIMNGGEISGNEAKDGGGVRVIQNGSFTMNNGLISGNDVYNIVGKGGGVRMEGNARFTMMGGTISDNRAWQGGGVLISDSSSFIMNGGTISKNHAIAAAEWDGEQDQDALGGGILVRYNGSFIMSGGTIAGNTARRGGGVFIQGLNFIKSGGIIFSNTAANGNTNGNQVFYDVAPYFYRDTELNTGDNISTADTVTNWNK